MPASPAGVVISLYAVSCGGLVGVDTDVLS